MPSLTIGGSHRLQRVLKKDLKPLFSGTYDWLLHSALSRSTLSFVLNVKCVKCYYLSSQIHRHHLGLKWPDGDALLNSRPVVVRVDRLPLDPDTSPASQKNLFAALSGLARRHFNSIRDVQLETWSVPRRSSSSSGPPLRFHLYWQDEPVVEFFTKSLLVYAVKVSLNHRELLHHVEPEMVDWIALDF